MTAKFCSQHLLTGLLLILISSLSLLVTQQKTAEAKPAGEGPATALRDWQLAIDEMKLLYLSHPHLNPLEQPRLRDYSWQAREQVKQLSRILHAAAFLIDSNDQESPRQQKAIEILTFPQVTDLSAIGYVPSRSESRRQ